MEQKKMIGDWMPHEWQWFNKTEWLRSWQMNENGRNERVSDKLTNGGRERMLLRIWEHWLMAAMNVCYWELWDRAISWIKAWISLWFRCVRVSTWNDIRLSKYKYISENWRAKESLCTWMSWVIDIQTGGEWVCNMMAPRHENAFLITGILWGNTSTLLTGRHYRRQDARVI